MTHSPPNSSSSSSRSADQIGAWLLLTVGLTGIAALVGSTWLGHHPAASNRCPEGTAPSQGRCCPQGQRGINGRCGGEARSCPPPLQLHAGQCVVPVQRVRVDPGSLQLGPGDWEAQGIVTPRVITVRRAFWIDRWEITVARWNQCVQHGRCHRARTQLEPGLPVTHVTATQSEEFCRWAGGHLPSEAQWLLAAAGPDNHRYPWGDTGAVCIKACWGLVDGPCFVGGLGPDLAGLHPLDRSLFGVQDMAGSVSEWVLRSPQQAVVHGGSWRTNLAASLRTWFVVEKPPGDSADDVGFRCVYDRPDSSTTTVPTTLGPRKRTPSSTKSAVDEPTTAPIIEDKDSVQ